MNFNNQKVNIVNQITVEITDNILTTVEELTIDENKEYSANMLEFASRFSIMMHCSDIDMSYTDFNGLYNEILFSKAWDEFVEELSINKIEILRNMINDFIKVKIQRLNSLSYFCEQFLDIIFQSDSVENVGIDLNNLSLQDIKTVKEKLSDIKTVLNDNNDK